MTLKEIKQLIIEEEKDAYVFKMQYAHQKNRVKALKLMAIEEEFGINLGSIVVSNGVKFRVNRIELCDYGGFLLHGCKKTNKGWGKTEKLIHNWKTTPQP